MSSYLDINHHKLGPPPDWRNYRTKYFGLVMDVASYIKDVESYIKQTHAYHFHVDIAEHDDLCEEIGEDAIRAESHLQAAMKILKKHARRWDSVDKVERDERQELRDERWAECEREETLNKLCKMGILRRVSECE